jgi:hypothetical protein
MFVSEKVTDEYAEVIADLPEVHVVSDGTTNWLTGGFHRHHAHKLAECKTIRARVRKGTWLDALVESLGENAEHGCRRTNQDKRKAVLAAMAVNTEQNLGWSNAHICRLCRVSHNYLADLQAEKNEPNPRNGGGNSNLPPPKDRESRPRPTVRRLLRGRLPTCRRPRRRRPTRASTVTATRYPSDSASCSRCGSWPGGPASWAASWPTSRTPSASTRAGLRQTWGRVSPGYIALMRRRTAKVRKRSKKD